MRPISRFTRSPYLTVCIVRGVRAMCVCVCSQRQRTGAAEEALHEARQVIARWPLLPSALEMTHTHDDMFPPPPWRPSRGACMHATVMGLDQ